jgi:hypothetical protein
MTDAMVAVILAVASLTPTATAVRSAETVPVATTVTTPALTGRCGRWEQTALAAGWPLEQWPTVDRIMWCESRCDPHARNRSGAAGLMQVMPGWWHGRDPYDPTANLAMARAVYGAQGWPAWSCN